MFSVCVCLRFYMEWRGRKNGVVFASEISQDKYSDWFIHFTSIDEKCGGDRYHRMAELGRDLWRSSGPTPLLTHSQLPRTMSRQLFNISEDGGSTSSVGNLCRCSVTPAVKECFPIFRWNLLCFTLCPLPLVLSLGTTERAWLHPFRTSVQVFIYINKILPQPSLLWAKQLWLLPFSHIRDAPVP